MIRYTYHTITVLYRDIMAYLSHWICRIIVIVRHELRKGWGCRLRRAGV